MNADALRTFFDRDPEAILADAAVADAHTALLEALESGAVRAAEPDSAAETGWRTNAWVKQAILLGFKRTGVVPMGDGLGTPFFDKEGYPARSMKAEDGVRVVPGGTTVRRGAHVAKGVVMMPPAYVNVGAYVGSGTMVDSHALVGSCAQIGERVHLSAGAQIGGVLEPAGAQPVVVEDEAFVGGLVGLFEGVLVRKRAVLASGVLITGSTTILDLVHGREIRREVPEGAVVVPGTRPASGEFAVARGVALATPVIVKYRDERTAAATALEDALR